MSILSLGRRSLTIRYPAARGHSRLDNAGLEGDYSLFDERPFLQTIPEAPVPNRIDYTQFQGVGRTRGR